jgi:hypothetical protein
MDGRGAGRKWRCKLAPAGVRPENADIKLAFGIAWSTAHGLIQKGLESQEGPVKYPLSRRTDYRQAGAGTSGRELIRLTDLKTSPARQCAENDLKPCAGMCGASPRLMPSMSLEWKMCSISMPRRPDPSGLWSASTKSPTQRIGEVRQPVSASPGNWNGASIAAMVRSASSSSWTRHGKGKRTACGKGLHAKSAMFTSPPPTKSVSSWTICPRISRVRLTRCSPPRVLRRREFR